ncbi:DUF6988 family protein [Dokdonella sp. MW10]|uniref:DUF6988 family protein n=1 Tax=Dokdonella sp. MW10 TaxID=2992926 RepID=UPI003F7FFE1F
MSPEEIAIWMPYHALLARVTQAANEGCDGLSILIPEDRHTVEWGIRSFHLAVEHAMSIQLLTAVEGPGHYGTAAALLRPLVEATMRGHFFAWCTLTEHEQEAFQSARMSFKPDPMRTRIREAPDCGEIAKRLDSVWKEYEGDLHRFTHGDIHQLCRRGSPDGREIDLQRDPHDYVSALRLAIYMAILSVVGIASLAGHVGLTDTAVRHTEELAALDDAYLHKIPTGAA